MRWWFAALAFAVGAVVFGRTLVAPLWRDDLLQHAMATGRFPSPRGPLDLYDFVRPSDRDAFVQSGVLPWWTDESLSVRFFRPLSSVMLFAEHRTLPPIAMHGISLLAWAAAVLSVMHLLRRTVGDRAAAFGCIVFAVAPCHALPLALLANREVFLSLALGALGLATTVKSESPSARDSLVAGVLFALSLGAGEYGLCLGGYVLARALVVRGTPARRAAGVLPFAVPAAAYLVVRAMLHYGATGTGFYRDPLADPTRFLTHAPRAIYALTLSACTTLEDGRLPAWASVAALGATLALALFALRRAGAPRELVWFALGALLSFVPVAASAPGVRLIGPAMLGVSAIVGAVADRAFSSRRAALAAIVLLGLHAGRASWLSWLLSADLVILANESSARAASLDEQQHKGATLVVPRGDWETAFLLPGTLSERPRVRVLTTARHALMLRIDATTIELVIPRGQEFFPGGTDDIFRPDDHPLLTGAARDVPGFHVVLVNADRTASARIRVTFDPAVADAPVVWLAESRDRFWPRELPAIGMGTQL